MAQVFILQSFYVSFVKNPFPLPIFLHSSSNSYVAAWHYSRKNEKSYMFEALDLNAGCPEGVCHRLQQRDSSCVTVVTDGSVNFSHPGLWCVSSIEHMGSAALFLQVTQSSDNPAETATRLLLPLGLSLFLWFFTQSVVLNFKHNLE